ncbi:MAG TPA: acyltransferase family protein [Anaerolineaceae bacterium]|nr:acyltransferase family protein [Anaerolineaceae bacterium]
MAEITRTIARSGETALRSDVKAAATAVRKERMFYIDNLRLVMIVFVILLHTAVTYSGLGSWYYKEAGKLDPVSFTVFGLSMTFTQGYFMGILFLIAGYFVPGAYDRKGFGKFVKDRLVRLGIPVLLYMLVIHPFIIYFIMGLPWASVKPAFLDFYTGYVTSLDFVGSSGPLWFALALLIFSIVYALYRLAAASRKPAPAAKVKVTSARLVGLTLAIALLAFLLRLVQPLGTSILNMQIGFFSQYLILFPVGILAYRQGWFSKIETALGMTWLRLGLIASPILWMVVMVGGGALDRGFDPFIGGMHWQALAFALWESFTAVAMSVGLITLFREKYNRQNGLVKILSDNSFAAYVFHAPVLISISLLLQPLAMYPLAKFLFVGPLAVIATFALTFLVLRRVPLLKKVI